jgi:hypothetical protein
MEILRDWRGLWVIGVINIIMSGAGLFAGAAVFGLPLAFALAALGYPQQTTLKWLAYSSPIWAPIGCGAGLGATGAIARGMRRKLPDV